MVFQRELSLHASLVPILGNRALRLGVKRNNGPRWQSSGSPTLGGAKMGDIDKRLGRLDSTLFRSASRLTDSLNGISFNAKPVCSDRRSRQCREARRPIAVVYHFQKTKEHKGDGYLASVVSGKRLVITHKFCPLIW